MGKKKNFPSYEEAKKLVVAKGVNSQTEYNSIYKVLGLPSTPSLYYKGKGWSSWFEFWGDEKMEYPSYEEAKMVVLKKEVHSRSEYKSICKSLGLPSCPEDVYKGKGWSSWLEFLGKEKIVYPSYEEAKKIVIANGIKSGTKYKLVCKSLGLPTNPNATYKGKGWSCWKEFWGEKKKLFPPYKEAQNLVIKYGVQSMREYHSICNALGLPKNPERTYKDCGWTSWLSFLCKDKKLFPTYKEAKKIVAESGIKSMKEYILVYKAIGLPSSPCYQYRDEGWIDWYDFLGKSKPISSSARKTKVYTTLSISPVLLEDNAPLQIVYMLASQIDKKLASEIEELLNTASCEDRLNMVKEQLKSLKADAEPMSVIPSEGTIGELSAMESMMDVFEDTLGSLPEDTTEYLNNIIKNYYHNATNRALIAEYDD